MSRKVKMKMKVIVGYICDEMSLKMVRMEKDDRLIMNNAKNTFIRDVGTSASFFLWLIFILKNSD